MRLIFNENLCPILRLLDSIKGERDADDFSFVLKVNGIWIFDSILKNLLSSTTLKFLFLSEKKNWISDRKKGGNFCCWIFDGFISIWNSFDIMSEIRFCLFSLRRGFWFYEKTNKWWKIHKEKFHVSKNCSWIMSRLWGWVIGEKVEKSFCVWQDIDTVFHSRTFMTSVHSSWTWQSSRLLSMLKLPQISYIQLLAAKAEW